MKCKTSNKLINSEIYHTLEIKDFATTYQSEDRYIKFHRQYFCQDNCRVGLTSRKENVFVCMSALRKITKSNCNTL